MWRPAGRGRNVHNNDNTQPAVARRLRFWFWSRQRGPNRTGTVRVTDSRSTEARKEASDGDCETDGSYGRSGTHLCEIIFSVVSPSVMVTLLLLMCAPLGLEGE